MEFGNPIIGQEELIRSAIKSKDFQSGENGVSGWRIARDGAATFYNLTVGSQNYFIDENGNASFQNVNADSILVNGMNVEDDLTNMARGIIALTTSSQDGGVFDGTHARVFNMLTIPDWDATRQYRICVNGRIDKGASNPTYIGVTCSYAWDSIATPTSPDLFEVQLGGQTGGTDWAFYGEHTISNSVQQGSYLSLCFSFFASVSGSKYQGTSYGRAWAEDIGSVKPYNTFLADTSAGSTPPPPPTQQYVKTWSSNESGCYAADGTNRTGYDSGHLFQGYYSGTNGNQFSFVGFDDANIRSTLSGATVNKVEIYLKNLHWYQNDGGTVYIGTHNQTTLSGNHSSSQILNDRISSSGFSVGQGKWFTVSNTIGTNLRDNTAKGIAIGQAPSNSQSYYGYFAGNGQSGEPQIRITYTK
jgi:hypothetical protein